MKLFPIREDCSIRIDHIAKITIWQTFSNYIQKYHVSYRTKKNKELGASEEYDSYEDALKEFKTQRDKLQEELNE